MEHLEEWLQHLQRYDGVLVPYRSRGESKEERNKVIKSVLKVNRELSQIEEADTVFSGGSSNPSIN